MRHLAYHGGVYALRSDFASPRRNLFMKTALYTKAAIQHRGSINEIDGVFE